MKKMPATKVAGIFIMSVVRGDSRQGFSKALPTATGRPVYDPADLLKKPRFLLRGRWCAGTEMSLATLVWNLKRAMAVLGKAALTERLAQA